MYYQGVVDFTTFTDHVHRAVHQTRGIVVARIESFVDWPGIKKDTVQSRSYQVNLAEAALRESSLIVLSTGLGKTVIAALVAANRLKQASDSKVLFLAPSRPLVDQQARFLRRVLELPESEVACLTGQDQFTCMFTPCVRRE